MEKFIKVVCTLLGCVAVSVMLFCITLMLCPGFTIFGVRYVGFVQEKYAGTQTLQSILSGKNVELNVNEMPVDIVFSNDATAYVKYEQSFVGFTTTKMNAEYVTITEDEGVYKVKINDPKSFVFGTNRINDSLKIVMPSSIGKLSFVGDTTNVTLSGAELCANIVNVESKGTINVNNIINANSFNVKNGTVNINKAVANNTIVNVNTEKNVNISGASNATYNIVTTYGKVSVDSCKNLYVTTSNGSVSMKDGACVSGDANIKTISGDITLCAINGKTTIETEYGNVSLERGTTAIITNASGSTNIDIVNALELNSKSGSVNISQITESANIKTTTGKVVLSDENVDRNCINNVNVSTTKGKIIINNVYGEKSSFVSEWGKITAKNINADRLIMTSEYGMIDADDIDCVSTQIVSNNKIDIDFVGVKDSVNIIGGNRVVNVSFAEGIDYDCILNATNKNAELSVDGNVVTGVSYKRAGQTLSSATVKISTKNGDINIK